jgi:TonB-dependent SusC/RagA subfamily outer membrane receptor
MKALDVDRIESVEVLKGRLAEWYYGGRAAEGVITITTKRSGGAK